MMNFPQLSTAEMQARLAPPDGRVRLAIDTDCANEIDDQWALAWALLSQERLEIEGVYAEPFSFRVFAAAIARAYELMQLPAVENEADQRLVERFHSRLAAMLKQGIVPNDVHYDGPEVGMERSYHEILKVYELLGIAPGAAVARGAPTYMTATDTPVPSAAAEHLIECALRADERPLYVAAIGCVTNVASAILMAPEIVRRIVVLWTAGYPTWTARSNTDSFNLVQDVPAAQVLFDCWRAHDLPARLSHRRPVADLAAGDGAVGARLWGDGRLSVLALHPQPDPADDGHSRPFWAHLGHLGFDQHCLAAES